MFETICIRRRVWVHSFSSWRSGFVALCLLQGRAWFGGGEGDRGILFCSWPDAGERARDLCPTILLLHPPYLLKLHYLTETSCWWSSLSMWAFREYYRFGWWWLQRKKHISEPRLFVVPLDKFLRLCLTKDVPAQLVSPDFLWQSLLLWGLCYWIQQVVSRD